MKTKFLLIFLFSNLTFAQLSFYEINGYAKYLFSSTKQPSISERLNDNLIHVRLNASLYPTENLKAVMELRMRGYYGNSVESIPDFENQIKNKQDYLNLDAVLWNNRKTIGYGEIDRLYLDGNFNDFQLTLGRQRIAWGTSWVWNPIDIFNPLSILDFDYEERPAVDAIRAQYYTGAVSKIEAAFKPAKDKKEIIAAGLASINIWDYDINLIGGIKNEKWLAGAGWVGDISGAGFRGEILLRDGRISNQANNVYQLDSKKLIYSFVLSGDYTFTNSFYIHSEVLHNSIGVTDSAALFQEASVNLGLLSPAKWSVYQEFAYDISPLMRGTIFGLFNPDDKSFVIVPSVKYSVITNLDLLLLGILAHGKSLTEFGDYGSTIYVRLTYSF